MPFDQAKASEAEALEVDGGEIGKHINAILDIVQRRRDPMSASDLADMFDLIKEGVCEACYEGEAYKIIDAAAALHFRPGAYGREEMACLWRNLRYAKETLAEGAGE